MPYPFFFQGHHKAVDGPLEAAMGALGLKAHLDGVKGMPRKHKGNPRG